MTEGTPDPHLPILAEIKHEVRNATGWERQEKTRRILGALLDTASGERTPEITKAQRRFCELILRLPFEPDEPEAVMTARREQAAYYMNNLREGEPVLDRDRPHWFGGICCGFQVKAHRRDDPSFHISLSTKHHWSRVAFGTNFSNLGLGERTVFFGHNDVGAEVRRVVPELLQLEQSNEAPADPHLKTLLASVAATDQDLAGYGIDKATVDMVRGHMRPQLEADLWKVVENGLSLGVHWAGDFEAPHQALLGIDQEEGIQWTHTTLRELNSHRDSTQDPQSRTVFTGAMREIAGSIGIEVPDEI